METILELPYPPTVNTYYRKVGNKMVISARGRQYKKDVERICMLSRVKKFTCERLEVFAIIYPPTRRKFDLDNCLKAMLDGMKGGGVYEDDEQIDGITIKRGPVDKNGPGAIVRIRPIDVVDHDFSQQLTELLATALHTSEVAH